MSDEIKNQDGILNLRKIDQYRTVEELFDASKASSIYYTLLMLSTFIVSAGLLLEIPAVTIGGMLVTPVLTPLLVIALGVATGEVGAISRESMLIAKSLVLIVLIAFVMGIIFGVPEDMGIFENSIRTAVLYFIVALSSGIAATFAWARKEMAEALPGVAIAVSIVPPMALMGIGFSALDLDLARFYFFITVFNVLGVILGSLIVFSLLKFHRAEKEIHRKNEEASQSDHQQGQNNETAL